jgi:hypothetical protein
LEVIRELHDVFMILLSENREWWIPWFIDEYYSD